MASTAELSFELREDRYSRQRLITGWDQEKLLRAQVLVAGAGALGNEVLKNLALAGIGKLVIIDFDEVEISNLSRSVLFTEEDIGRPKASTAAHALSRLNPEVCVQSINGDLETDLGLGAIRGCDVVLGCLDSIYSRWVLNRACRRAGRPWIDAGIGATVGEVCLYLPTQGACYECGMNAQMWQQIHERRSCMLVPRKPGMRAVPTTAIIASITAALQVNEALALIQGNNRLTGGEMLFFSSDSYSLSNFTTKENKNCFAHEVYEPVIIMDVGPAEITARQLLQRIPAAMSLQLDFDVVHSLQCGQCGKEPAGRRLHTISREELLCELCWAERKPELIHEIGASDSLAEKSLHELGVPSRSVLRIRTGVEDCYVELTR